MFVFDLRDNAYKLIVFKDNSEKQDFSNSSFQDDSKESRIAGFIPGLKSRAFSSNSLNNNLLFEIEISTDKIRLVFSRDKDNNPLKFYTIKNTTPYPLQKLNVSFVPNRKQIKVILNNIIKKTYYNLIPIYDPESIIIESTPPNNSFSTLSNQFHIILLGYKLLRSNGSHHTNWFPWNRLYDVFKNSGYNVEWLEVNELNPTFKRDKVRRIYICWNDPTSIELCKMGVLKQSDIVFQKLTSLGKGMETENWGVNPTKWCQGWRWPIYQTLEYLYDLGVNIYGFGCASKTQSFGPKERISNKLKDRIFWIMWGGTAFNLDDIIDSKPKINTNFKYDIGFVGSKWGKVGRGNIDQWNSYIQPLLTKYKNNSIAGMGITVNFLNIGQAYILTFD